MRYIYLVLAALSAWAFVALQIPQSHIPIRFLSSLIYLPGNSLATLAFVLGAVTGIFFALFVSSLVGRHGLIVQTAGSHTRSGV